MQKMCEWAYKWKMSLNSDLNKQDQELIFSRKLNKSSYTFFFNNARFFCANWRKHFVNHLTDLICTMVIYSMTNQIMKHSLKKLIKFNTKLPIFYQTHYKIEEIMCLTCARKYSECLHIFFSHSQMYIFITRQYFQSTWFIFGIDRLESFLNIYIHIYIYIYIY